MANIKYALREVRKHPGKYFPIYAQIIVSVILVAFIAVNFQQVHEFSAKMSACTEHRNMYAVIDRSDVVTIMNTLNMDGAEEKCKELYDYTNECVDVYVHMINMVRWNGMDIEVLQMNQNFYDLYQIDVQQGRTFNSAEWEGQIEDGQEIPVLVGKKLAKVYPIGTTFVNEALDKSTFKVVGILNDQTFYLNPSVNSKTISLDFTFIIPWIPRDALNNGYRNVNLFHVLQLETDNPEVLNKIAEKSKELGLFDLEFTSFREQIGVVKMYYQKVYSRDCAMLGVLLLYCIVGSITMLLQYIDTHMKYNSIHILCGATQQQMGLQMLIHILIPILMGLVFVMAIFKSIFAMIVGILFGMVLLFIILIIPLLKWNRMELSQIFKRYE